jgi:hypothetical protein
MIYEHEACTIEQVREQVRVVRTLFTGDLCGSEEERS